MSLGRRFVSTGAGDAVCLTESVQVFGADSTYSSNKLLYQFENNVTNDVGSPSATNSGATFSSTAKFGSYSADFAGTTEHIDTGYNIAIDYNIAVHVYARDYTNIYIYI